jgi:hypothetical protein
VSTPQSPARSPQARTTFRLSDLALQDRDSVYRTPHGPDWLWLGLFSGVVLFSGLYIWTQMGIEDETGREIFFAGVLLSLLWVALIYTFKLSMNVTVGQRGLSLVRGPWRTELTWAEVARVSERPKSSGGQQFRWIIASAHDGRELRIREDMVDDYARFRLEVFERLRLFHDHGGTWGTTGGGPFSASDEVANRVTWWLIGAGVTLLPGIYFLALFPDLFGLGASLCGLAALCALCALRARLSRQTYAVDRRELTMRRPLRRVRLLWGEGVKVERLRSRFRLFARIGILCGRVALALGAQADGRVESFSWSPRVPEYLIVRGKRRRVRIRLHRLARPDEMLAWVEFYDRVAHEAQGRPAPSAQPMAPAPQPELPDMAGASGPADPWAGHRGGAVPQSGHAAAAASATGAAGDASAAGRSAPGPRVTRVLPDLDPGSLDPRIQALIADVEASESRRPVRQDSPARSDGSDWLNDGPAHKPASPPFAPPAPAPVSEEATIELPSAAPFDYSAPPPIAPKPIEPGLQESRPQEQKPLQRQRLQPISGAPPAPTPLEPRGRRTGPLTDGESLADRYAPLREGTQSQPLRDERGPRHER